MTTFNVTNPRQQVLVDQEALQQMQGEFQRRGLELGRLKTAFETLSAVNAPARFMAAAMALCNELASRFNCEHVALGFLKGRYVRLSALSHTEKITRNMQHVQDIEASMEECLDQDVEILYPPAKDASYVYRTTELLANRTSPTAVLSLPLRRAPKPGGETEVVAVLTLQRKISTTGAPTDKPFSIEEIEALRLTADLFTPRIYDLHETDKWFGAKAARSVRNTLAFAIGPKHTWAKAIAIAVAAFLAFAIFAQGTFKIEAPFVLQAVEKQSVAAPFDAVLDKVNVEIGEAVMTDETARPFDRLNRISPLVPITVRRPRSIMALLDTTEWTNRLIASRAEYEKQITQANDAQRQGKTAEQQMAEAESRRAQADIDLYTYKIAQAQIKAPIDGVIFTGDLKPKVGALIKAGEELFTVGQHQFLRAELSVPEDQITDLTLQKKGELASTSYPGDHIPFTVELIDPVGTVSGNKNVFKVRVRFDPKDVRPWMKPGMEGVAKVHVGKASYAWIWTRRLINWVRMKLWL